MKKFKIVYRFRTWPLSVVSTVGVVEAVSVKAARAQALQQEGLIIISCRRVNSEV
jgi:hypothetical protein